MVKLADLKPSARLTYVREAADAILAEATAPLGSRELAEAIGKAHGWAPADVGWQLSAIAKAGHPSAYETGETFNMYGRTAKRVAWRPASLWTIEPEAS